MAEEYKKKVFKFKGKSVEEWQELDVREFAKLLDSRRRRTVLRNFQEAEDFIKLAREKQAKGKPIKTHKRHLVILPQHVGMKIQIYNGRQFVPFEVTGEMIGHKFGEFAITRNRIKHEKKGVGATKGSKAKSKK